MKILVFLHGTTIMHKNAIGYTREEIVKQVIAGDKSVRDQTSYVPVGKAVKKLQTWKKQGAEICYLSPLTKSKDVRMDERASKDDFEGERLVLGKHQFPRGEVYHRKTGEQYEDIVERIVPDVLIEDDCESIGGESEMTYPSLKPELKAKIKSIVVKEFSGIDHLPDSLSDLLKK